MHVNIPHLFEFWSRNHPDTTESINPFMIDDVVYDVEPVFKVASIHSRYCDLLVTTD
jgi:hypothetical protein